MSCCAEAVAYIRSSVQYMPFGSAQAVKSAECTGSLAPYSNPSVEASWPHLEKSCSPWVVVGSVLASSLSVCTLHIHKILLVLTKQGAYKKKRE